MGCGACPAKLSPGSASYKPQTCFVTFSHVESDLLTDLNIGYELVSHCISYALFFYANPYNCVVLCTHVRFGEKKHTL